MNAIRALLASLILIISCQPVPITGRKQFNLVPDKELNALAAEQYQSFLDSAKVQSGTDQAEDVKAVGDKIKVAVEEFFKDDKDRTEGYEWEFNLIEDTLANAFAMPGGKVAVFTGILPITQNRTGLAVVMGHEIAHVVARHANERMSQILALQLGGLALGEALKKNPQKTRQLALGAFGLGAQVGVLLPYSRVHENEADKLGLIFMAMAGYDPRQAVDFWRRMEQEAGPRPPELLSTHPSGESRIRAIEKEIPEAMKYYRPEAQGE